MATDDRPPTAAGGENPLLASLRRIGPESLLEITSALREGLVAVDGEDRVLLVNRSARSLFGIESRQVEGKPLVEVVRQPTFVTFVQQVRRSMEFGSLF